MKILMVTMSLGIGGAETHIVELTRELRRMGHDVTVASAGGVFADELATYGVRHVTLPLADKSVFSVVTSYRGLSELIGKEKFDIVHGHARIPDFILSYVRRRHSFRFATTAHLDFAVNALWRRLTEWGERTLAVSDDIKDYLVREYGVSPDKIGVTINGIDDRKFSPDVDYSGVLREFSLDADRRRIVYISRMDADRSAVAFMLCECAPSLAGTYPDLDVVIVGSGNDYERLAEAAEKANSAAGRRVVTLCGARSDTNCFCAMADVFVGVSRSALEAMAAHVPVVVAGNQGYLGILTESNTELARSANFCARGCPKSTATALERDLRVLLGMPEDKRRDIGEYGYRVVTGHYSVGRMAQDYLDCWKQMGIG